MSTGNHELIARSQLKRTAFDSAPSTFAAPFAGERPGAFAQSTRPAPSHVSPSWWPERILCRSVLIAVLLALVPPPGPAHPKVHRIPFRTVQSMILVEGKVDGRPLTFLLDTGAIGTIVSTRIYASEFPLRRIHRNFEGPGLSGESVPVRINLELGDHRFYAHRVSVMNLDELSRLIGIEHIDGLLGQDVLREFRYVRIDYKSHVIELEE